MLASPGDPALSGAQSSYAYTGGIGYNMGPFGIGAVFYGMSYDDSEGGAGLVGKLDHVEGEGVAGSYVVGPGVVLQMDAYTYNTKLPTNTTRGNILALASLFSF